MVLLLTIPSKLVFSFWCFLFLASVVLKKSRILKLPHLGQYPQPWVPKRPGPELEERWWVV